MTDDPTALRSKVIEALVHGSPTPPGRTAIMKLAYFLQTLFEVPLGYRFKLYTYGPYDAEVLNDLAMVEQQGLIKSQLTTYPNGNQGYLYSKPKAAKAPKLSSYADAVKKALDVFGGRTASDLEMVSTIIFVDRSQQMRGQVSTTQIVNKVHEIKPHLSTDKISTETHKLLERGYLLATTA